MRRALCVSLALALLLETSSWAQVVRGVSAPAGQTVLPPAVPIGAASPQLSLGPQNLSLALTPSALPSAPNASVSVLPSAVADPALAQTAGLQLQAPAPLALPASQISPQAPKTVDAPALPAVRAQAPVTLRGMLVSAAAALAQNPLARRLFPGLGRLGSEVSSPRPEAGIEEQAAGAELLFDQKTFGKAAHHPGAVEGHPNALKGQLQGNAAQSARRIRFNGKEFPAEVFRPDTALEPLLVKAIDAAKTSVQVALVEFRMHDVLRALRRARERGVKVEILMDMNAAFPAKPGHPNWAARRDLELQLLLNEGFDVAVLTGLGVYGFQHNRFALIDGRFAEFGSARWVPDEDINDHDSAQFSDDPHRVEGLRLFWDYLRSLAEPFATARERSWPKTVPAPPQDDALPVRFNGVSLPAWFLSPGGSAEDWIVKVIDAAEESLDLAMFTFRSTRVAQALLRASERGVKVRVLFDRGQAGRDYMKPYAERLAFHRIPVRLVPGPNSEAKYSGRQGNQFLVADGELLQTGSMNWTKNAFLMSFENGQFLTEAKDVKAFSAYFNSLFKAHKSQPLFPPKEEPALPSDDELVKELQAERPPLPKIPSFPSLPAVPQMLFNGESFPAAAARPQTPIEPLLVKAIDATKKTLRIALYEFNLQGVLEALRRAKERGVDVQIILDHSHVYPGARGGGVKPQRKPQIQALIDEGFDVVSLRGAGSSGIMHNKFAIFDGALVETGSYNWSDTAEHNHFENLVFFDERERIAYYEKFWDWMRSRAQPIGKAEGFDWESSDPGEPPADTDAPIEHNGRKFPRQIFSPNGDARKAILQAICAAKATIEIAMFTFYSQQIADALLQMKERGVHVRIVLDASQSKNMKLDEWFAYHGFDVRILAGPDPHAPWMFEKNHNKFMIVDGKLVETGSYNFTDNAELNNFENINFIADAARVAFFTAFFQLLHDLGWKPSKPEEPSSAALPGASSVEQAF